MSEKLSAHFTVRECKCPCCGLYVHQPQLLDLAEKVRSILQTPMIVTSGTRCVSHNASVGGSPTSKHLQGLAMDFYCRTLSPTAVYNAVVKAWYDGRLPELGGVGLYDWGVHIDVYHAQDGHLRRWDRRKGATA